MANPRNAHIDRQTERKRKEEGGGGMKENLKLSLLLVLNDLAIT